MNTWQMAWRLACYRPWLYASSVALWTGVHSLPVITGLATGYFSDGLDNNASFGLNVVSVIVLLVTIEVTRMVCFFGAAVVWTYNWQVLEAVLRTNMLGWIVEGGGARRLPGNPGEVVSRFRDDAESFVNFLDTWLDVIGSAVFALVAVVIMASVDARITGVVVLPLLATVVITRLATSRVRLYRRQYRVAEANVTAFIGDAFGAVQAIKVADVEGPVTNEFDRLGDIRQAAAVRDRVFSELLNSYSANAGSLSVGIVLFLAVNQMRAGSFTVGEFALFASYLTWLTGLPRWLGWLLTRHRQAGVSADRMSRLLSDAPPGAIVSKTEIHLSSTPEADVVLPLTRNERLQALEVSALTCTHRNGRGLRDITFTVERGTFTVVTGRIGSGKTTLLRGLLGLVAADSGTISWNGAPIAGAAEFMVPPRCAYTPQVPRLLSESLGDNVLLGRADENGAVARAVRLAVLEDDVSEMPDGLATLLGPRGVRLSGGQIQRTAAARMYAREPELLVFDDISSALDVETEEQLWSRLFATGDVTCLVVSNRPAAYRRADQILVLKDGELAGKGTLAELLRDCEEMRILSAGDQDGSV